MADSGLVILAVCCLLGVMLIKLVTKLYHVRQEFRGLQRQGLPMPPHHLLFGHLPLVAISSEVYPSVLRMATLRIKYDFDTQI